MLPIIFTSDAAAAGFAVIIAAFFVAEQVGGVIVPWIRRGGARIRRHFNLSGFFVIASWMAVLVAVAGVGKLGYGLLPNWVYYVGLVVMVAGIVFRQYAIAVLGRYFSGALGVQADQKVVQSGPYRYIRHPSYSGVLIFFVGMGLAFQSWVAALLAVAVFAVAYGYRIFVEEKVLVLDLGQDYTDYKKRTKRLIPKIV